MEMISKNLYFDYSACLIILILIITTFMRHMVTGKVNRYFMEVLIVALIINIFDIGAVILDNQNGADVFAKYVMHTGYLVGHSLSIPFYI